MESSHFVSFIGSGNLAWHLAPALDNAGFVVNPSFEAITFQVSPVQVMHMRHDFLGA